MDAGVEPEPDPAGYEDLRRRFADRYRGEWNVEDALRWRLDPLQPDRSGAPSPFRQVEDLRRQLYRPGTAADVEERYVAEARRLTAASDEVHRAWRVATAAAIAEDSAAAVMPELVPSPQQVSSGRLRRIRAVVGVVAVATGAAVLAVLGVQAARQDLAVPLEVPAGAAAGLQIDEGLAFAGEGSYRAALATEAIARTTNRWSGSAKEAVRQPGARQGAGWSRDGAVLVLDGRVEFVHDFDSGGLLWVQVLVKRPTAWTWTISGVSADRPDPHVLAVARGSSGALLQEQLLHIDAGATPTAFRIDTDGDVPFHWRAIGR